MKAKKMFHHVLAGMISNKDHGPDWEPVYVLRASDYEAMVEQMCKGLYAQSKFNPPWSKIPNDEAEDARKDMRAALRAIGITPKKASKS